MVGITDDDIFQNMVNYGMFTGGLGFHYGAEKIGMTVMPAGTGNTKRQIEMIDDFGVTTIHCTPLCDAPVGSGRGDGRTSLDSLKTGLFGAEPWSESTRKMLEKRLGVTAYDSYGLSEPLRPGRCLRVPRAGRPAHLARQLPRRDHRPEHGRAGRAGRTRRARGHPARQGGHAPAPVPDRRRDHADGRRLPLRPDAGIARITGRSDDMLVIRGINVFPSQIEHVPDDPARSRATSSWSISTKLIIWTR